MKLAKVFFIVLLSSFIGIIANPELPFASDSVVLTGIDGTRVVETVPLPEPTPETAYTEPVYEEPAYSETAYNEPVYDEPVYEEPVYEEPVYEQYVANYNVTYYVGSKDEFNAIAHSLSYYDIYRFKKMIYGHNSWNLLGNITERYIGEVFTVTEGGLTKSYRVANIAIYEKTADGNLEWDSRLMGRIANGNGHSISLLTCYGTSYGNGDASHRYVVYADEI